MSEYLRDDEQERLDRQDLDDLEQIRKTVKNRGLLYNAGAKKSAAKRVNKKGAAKKK